MSTALSIDQFIEDQVRRWESSRREQAAKPRRLPLIAIAGQPGCGAKKLSRVLAERLGLDFFDDEILKRVAESSHLSEAVLRSVDERSRTLVEEWVQALFTERYLSGEYLRHLSRAISTIAAHGRAIVVGHGAPFLAPPDASLRVLLVAPLEDRIREAAAAEKVSRSEARRRLEEAETERAAYIRQYFRAEFLDPARYDLALNTAALGRDAVLTAVETAWISKRDRAPAA